MYLSIIELCWFRVTQLIQFCLACLMYHQYLAARGIMFVPPIEFGKRTFYDTRTPSYFANLDRTACPIPPILIS